MAHDPKALDCLACPAFCCRQAGYVEVNETDIRRLAKFLDMSVRAFEAKHVLEKTRRGSKRIKPGYEACQFLDNNRRCSVYEARPKDCRGYVCWNQPDTTVYEFAQFYQTPVDKLHAKDRREAEKAKAKT